MAPVTQNPEEKPKSNPRQPHIILLTLPPSSFSTPTQSLRVRFSIHTSQQDKLYRMERPSSQHTFGSGEIVPGPARGRTTPSSTTSTISSQVSVMVTEQTKIQKDLGQVSQDVRLTKSRLDELERRMTNLEDKMETKFNQVDRKFAQVDTKLAQVDTKLAQVDTKLAQVDAKLDQILDMMASRGQPTFTTDTAVAPGRASMSVPDLSTTAHVREHSSRNPLVKRILGATRGFIGQITNHAADFNRQLEHLEQRGIPEEDEGQRQHQSNAGSSRSGTSRSGQRSGQQAPPPWLNQQIMPDRR